MDLVLGSAAGVLLAFTVVTIHAETLDLITHRFLPRFASSRRWHVGATVLILTTAHVLEIVVFALAHAASIRWLGIGHLEGVAADGPGALLYFSFSCYTSLGMGDVYAVGGLRLLAGMESLIGLLMIGWSASFLLLEMREFRGPSRRVRRTVAPAVETSASPASRRAAGDARSSRRHAAADARRTRRESLTGT